MTSQAPTGSRSVSATSNARVALGADDHQQYRQQSPDEYRPYHGEDDLYGDDEEEQGEQDDLYEEDDSELPPLPMSSDSFLNDPASFVNNAHSDAVYEREMRRKLMDVESSFVPDLLSARAGHERTGADDTYLHIKHQPDENIQPIHEQTDDEADALSPVLHPSSPAAAAAERSSLRSEGLRRPSSNDHDLMASFQKLTIRSNSSKEPLQSSSSREQPFSASSRAPTRSVSSREVSYASSSRDPPYASSSRDPPPAISTREPTSPKPEEIPLPISDRSLLDMGSLHSASSHHLQKRPSFVSQRNTSHLSAVSNADTDYSAGDYALQTGGAIPDDNSFGPNRPLSRLPSLGSVVSAMSRESEPNPPPMTRGNSVLASIRAERALGSLQEEDKASNISEPVTPRPPDLFDFALPTDTIVARHVQNIQVPDTIAKEYRQQNRSISPDKRPASSSNALTFNNRPGGNLTLKEQNSKIDKLTKENFDLKLKIHFLDQALQDRSDEGVKDMINKNVQFQTDLANERKENQSLRRKLRDLEKRFKQQEQDLADAQKAAQDAEGTGSHEELEYEILQLSEELERRQAQVARLSAENMAKEVEKRKMKEYMTAMNDGRRVTEHETVEEESEMWKDLLTTETARREQAEEDSRKLREEIMMLRSERSVETNLGVNANRMSKLRSQSIESEALNDRSGAATASSVTLVEQLQHENAELRRDLGAQTSMLTSRNRERERLQQEIEDLKLLQRKSDGSRSLTGDDIFDRSVSRAQQYRRPTSRASGQTGAQMSDGEREEWEQREGILRDQNAALRMDVQEMQQQLNEQGQLVTELEEAVQISENELDAAVGDLRTVQSQRNEAYQALEQLEVELEQVKGEHEKLRIEAVSAIEDLEDNLDKTEQARQLIASDLKDRNDDFLALQRELRELNGSFVQLDDDRTAALKRIEMLEQELEDTTQELEALDRKLQETAQKNQRLEVQSESLHGEISFLREEQEGDKIKIGDLENSLNAAQQMIQDEREKMEELEDNLIEERRQRDILDNQSKQEVQEVLDGLNSENAQSKDEIRRLKRNLSSKETEATTFKNRLEELEDSLRRVLGDLNGKRTGWLQEIQKLQSDLENTIHDLNEAKSQIAEKERLLRNRDMLLESSGLESRRLSELLDKERAARRKDLHQFEQAQRGSSTNARRMAQHESRALEMETARSADRRKMVQLEQQYRDQLSERNTLLFALWNRLSTLCGNEWAELHGLVNGEVPSVDVISRSLPGFNRNIIDAVKTIESLMTGFKTRIRSVEKSLRKDYQTLEQNLDARIKRMDFLERSVKDAQGQIDAQAQEQAQLRSQQNMNRSSVRNNEEVTRLKQEIKVLKSEMKFQKQHPGAESSTAADTERNKQGSNLRPPSIVNPLLRHHSSSAIETLQQQQQQNTRQPPPRQSSIVIATPPLQPSEQRWIHRLKELERRLKAEREGRLLDRKGARQRLEERDSQIEDMRLALEREKDRRASFDEGSEGGDGRMSRMSRKSGRGQREGSLD